MSLEFLLLLALLHTSRANLFNVFKDERCTLETPGSVWEMVAGCLGPVAAFHSAHLADEDVSSLFHLQRAMRNFRM